jgi:opacity protein-like surface antigen
VEYLHVDLGKGASYVFTGAGGGILKYTERNSDDVVRVGLNYKFGG